MALFVASYRPEAAARRHTARSVWTSRGPTAGRRGDEAQNARVVRIANRANREAPQTPNRAESRGVQ